MSWYGLGVSLVPNWPRLLTRQGAAPLGAGGNAGGSAGGSALPKLESEIRPAPSAALVPRYSAPDLMNSRRRAYSSGAVISLLAGWRGRFRMRERALSDLCFGGPRQRLAG